MKIGICIVATNIYLLLGLKLIHRWRKYYKGNAHITFYLFTDRDPKDYIDTKDIVYLHSSNDSWVDGTNSKFKNILRLESCDEDYLFYFDADTDIINDFNEDWFIGDLVGGQHWGDLLWMANEKPYDRNPKSAAYIPIDTDLKQVYYYGAFFGGAKRKLIDFCKTLRKYQLKDQEIQYEPGVNDESYINREFHYNPPTRTVLSKDFEFMISHKGGLDNTRGRKDVDFYLQEIRKNNKKSFDIKNGELLFN
jgi:histo-blood group ABO system transferase